jgi:MFS transporter, UMF1 family
MAAQSSARVFSWALYDFANTIFSMNVISMYMPLWVTGDMGGRDIHYSIAVSGSMLAAGVAMPLMGAASDRMKRRMPFLTGLTLVCVLATAGIGLTGNLVLGLVLFGVANFCYQGALVPYDALLPEVSRGGRIGRVAGLGVALGYAGSIAGLKMVEPIVGHWGRHAAFVPSGMLFLLFALPAIIVLKDAPAEKPALRTGIGRQLKKIRNTLAHTRRYPGLTRFLIANLLYSDAVNTVIVFMAVYASKVVGMNDRQIVNFMVVSTVFAAAGSFGAGRLTDRLGPAPALKIVLWMWVAALGLAGASMSAGMFWVVGPLAGASLGGTWVASRALVAGLTPPRKYGEVYGLYNLGGRFGAVTGPLIWGGTILLLEPAWGAGAYRAAIFTLMSMVLAALAILRGLKAPGHLKEPA